MLPLNLDGRVLAAIFLCLAVCRFAPAQASSDTLQSAMTQAMAARRGAAVVLDVSSGRILASYHLDVAARRLVHPGSSIKPFTLLALLQAGKVNDRTALICRRSVVLAGRKMDCSHPPTSQPLDPAEALAYSCNSYFTTVATRLTPAQLHDSLLTDGFASVTGLAKDEVAGSVALAHSTDQLQLQAIGEWGIDITPLELAKGYRNLALLATKREAELMPLFDGLAQSVSYGMGHMAQPPGPVKVAGKTGTAAATEGPWTHAWFAGYASADNPEIVLVVFLEKGHGGSDAAGVAQQIFAAFAQARHGSLSAEKSGARP